MDGCLYGAKISEIVIKIQTFSIRKMHFKMLSMKWQAFYSFSERNLLISIPMKYVYVGKLMEDLVVFKSAYSISQ